MTVLSSNNCTRSGVGSASALCSVPIGSLSGYYTVLFTKKSVYDRVSPTANADFVLSIYNYGNQYTSGFTVTDSPSTIDPVGYLSLVAGSLNVDSPQCTIESGQRVGDKQLVVSCDEIPGSCGSLENPVEIRFSAMLLDGLDDTVQTVCNQAILSFDDRSQVLLSDNPNTTLVSDPTCLNKN